MPPLESIIASHREHLEAQLALYTDAPEASQILAEHMEALAQTVEAAAAAQRAAAAALVEGAQTEVDAAWARVAAWRAALGDPAEPAGGPDAAAAGLPLRAQLRTIHALLDSMRGRIETRGAEILRLQRALADSAEILGPDFLSLALDDVDMGWEGLDLRRERRDALDAELARCTDELASRRAALDAAARDIFALRADMGFGVGDSADTNTVAIADGASLADDFDELALAHVGLAADGSPVTAAEIVPTAENVARAERRRARLLSEKEARNQAIQQVYDRLYPLWTMMGISEEEMDRFATSWMGSSLFAVQAYKDECARMEEIKKRNISVFIQSERETIAQLWDKLYLSEQQRASSFPEFYMPIHTTVAYNEETGEEEVNFSDDVSEDLLFAHEHVRAGLQQRLETLAPILERIKRYFDLVQEMKDLEASSSDPTRLLGKRGDPGRLLREEKARKRVTKEKPKLEHDLLRYIPVWEEEHGEPFLVNGRRFIEDLEEQLNTEAHERDRRGKRGPTSRGTPAVASTPSVRQQRTGPLTQQRTGRTAPLKRDMTGASVSSTASAPRAPPYKRQALQASHTGMSHRVPATPRPLAATATGYNPPSQQPYRGAVLSEIGNRPLTRAAKAAEKPAAVAKAIVPVATGMRLPNGWGGTSTTGLGLSSQTMAATGLSSGRLGNGFRPRPSMNPVASIMNR